MGTITGTQNPAKKPLPGFREIKPQMFGFISRGIKSVEALRTSLEKLSLNDVKSLNFEPENSSALGFGFRCGFLGLLHMDIIQERLEREYEMELITTAPTVYELLFKNGEVKQIENLSKLPKLSTIEEIREPLLVTDILLPKIMLDLS